MKNGEFLDLYVVHVVNETEVVEEDMGLTNLLTGLEIENLEDINLEVDEEFNEPSEKINIDVDIVDETEQYVEEHLDGVETNAENSSDLEEGIPEEVDSEVDEELRSVKEEKRSKKKSKQQRKNLLLRMKYLWERLKLIEVLKTLEETKVLNIQED
ncbi:hypothetical protein HAX54_052660 [Datura stramonium]|uniref:Uncharacterized protein n=1 Tax=Datura stramonium TaxID=4076 RepID=A0ABS8SZA4_DATST|nr:hypothetical protein [Datura stramonium]